MEDFLSLSLFISLSLTHTPMGSIITGCRVKSIRTVYKTTHKFKIIGVDLWVCGKPNNTRAEVQSAQPFFLLSLPHVILQNLGVRDEGWSPLPPAMWCLHLISSAYLSGASLLLQIKIQILRCAGTAWLVKEAAI